MHSSGSITRKFGPSWKQSTGHTSTQSVYLHLMQFSVTTKGMEGSRCGNEILEQASRRCCEGFAFARLPPPQPSPARGGGSQEQWLPAPSPACGGGLGWGHDQPQEQKRPACAGLSELALPTGFEPVF